MFWTIVLAIIFVWALPYIIYIVGIIFYAVVFKIYDFANQPKIIDLNKHQKNIERQQKKHDQQQRLYNWSKTIKAKVMILAIGIVIWFVLSSLV